MSKPEHMADRLARLPSEPGAPSYADLEAQNADLLAALKEVAEALDGPYHAYIPARITEVIANAES